MTTGRLGHEDSSTCANQDGGDIPRFLGIPVLLLISSFSKHQLNTTGLVVGNRSY